MAQRAWLFACIAFLVAACARPGVGPGQAASYSPAAYARRVSTNEVTIYWNCSLGRDEVRMEGIVQSSKGGQVKFFELELAGADARNRYVSARKAALADIILYTNQISPFSLQLQPAGGEGRYDLFYEYRLSAAFGTDPAPRFLARDVCSPTRS